MARVRFRNDTPSLGHDVLMWRHTPGVKVG